MDGVSFDNVWGGITTHDNADVNAEIVADSFKTDMLIFTDPQKNPQNIKGHLIEFNNYSHPLQEKRLYNFSVLIHVQPKNPNGPPIKYYPTFSIALSGIKTASDSSSNLAAVTPASLLPKYMHYAGGSTNVAIKWTYSCTYMLGFTLNSASPSVENKPTASSPTTSSPAAPLLYAPAGALALVAGIAVWSRCRSHLK